MRRQLEEGVVLVNVLVILAIAATVIFLMLQTQDIATDRGQRLSAASAAEALARGAEASVVTALRRDLEEAPNTDHYGEAWATGQEAVALETGAFSLKVRDAQAKLDLGRLRAGQPADIEVFLRLFRALDLPAAELRRAALELAGRGGVSDIAELDSLSTRTREALAPHIDLLPKPATLNLNTASPLLLRAMMANPSAATRLLAIRDRTGRLDPDDFVRVGALVPLGAGLRSDVFDATILAEVDGVRVNLQSRIVRGATGELLVMRRRFGAPIPSGLSVER
ncbi:MAG: type II secretion system protein GspK [Pseudomonadota bacterium]